MLGLQNQVHRSNEMVSGGHNNSEEMPTSIINSDLDGHLELGNSSLSYWEGVNGLCSEGVGVRRTRPSLSEQMLCTLSRVCIEERRFCERD